MVSWLDRGKTFAVYKKQIKNKIQNKQTEKPKHCPAAIMSSWKNTEIIFYELNELYFPKEKM